VKFRTDFVTNSSSSSFVTVNIKSDKFATLLKRKKSEIEKYNSGWDDIIVEIRGDEIEISRGDRDAEFFYPPHSLNDAISTLEDVLRTDIWEDIEKNRKEFFESIESIDWKSECIGMDGDDGSSDLDNYSEEALAYINSQIADAYNCNENEITPQMFSEFVKIEPDTITAEGSYNYNKTNRISTYFYTNRMSIEKCVREELAVDDLILNWMNGKHFVFTGLDYNEEEQYENLITSAGGFVRTSTVMETNVLIYNEHYVERNGETSKLKRAKELIGRGKKIAIITEDEFIKLIKHGKI
jgi:hypothetical protein